MPKNKSSKSTNVSQLKLENQKLKNEVMELKKEVMDVRAQFFTKYNVSCSKCGNKPAKAENVTIRSVKRHNGTSNNEQDPRPSTSTTVFENEIFDNDLMDENISPIKFNDETYLSAISEENISIGEITNYRSVIEERNVNDEAENAGIENSDQIAIPEKRKRVLRSRIVEF